MRRLLIATACALAATAPLAAQQAPGCADIEGIGDFDFWVGEWDVYDKAGNLAGRNNIEKRALDCVIVENWSPGTEGVKGGTSLNYVDPATGKWTQLWVGGNTHIFYSGGLTEEGAMLLEGTLTYFGAGGSRSSDFRGRWTPNADGTVTQLFHEKNAETGEWTEWFEGLYKRREPASETE